MTQSQRSKSEILDYDVPLSNLKAMVSPISVIPCGADQVQRFDKDAV